MKAKSKLFILLIAASFCLTGCYDSREVDDEVYAISIGVDKGVENKIRLTIQYPTYRSDSGSQGMGDGGARGTNQQESSNVHTMECPSIVEGLDMMGMAISRRVSLMHAKMLVFSEDLAKSGVGTLISPIERFRETRSSMAVVVVKGAADKFIQENKSNIGGTISKATELMFLQAKYSNYFPYIQFKDFYRFMLSPYQQPVAIYGGVNNFNVLREEKVKNPPLVTREGFLPGMLPRKGVAKREFTGVAVFDGDKMVGELDSYETTYYLMIIGKFPEGAVTFEDMQDTDKALVLDIRNSRKPKIKAYIKKGKPVVDLQIELEADIMSIQSKINYEKKEKLQELNDYVRDLMLKDMKRMIKKTQQEYKADIFGFGRYMAANFSTIQEFEEYDWLSQYPEVAININLKVEIRRSGTMMKSSPILTGKHKHKIGE